MEVFHDRRAVLLILLAVLVTLPFVRTTGGADTFYTTDANVYYRTSQLLVSEAAVGTSERTLGWVLWNGTYYPAMPIGYSLLSIVPGVLVDALSGDPAPRLRPGAGIAPVVHSRYVAGAYWIAADGSYHIDGGEGDTALQLAAQMKSLDGSRQVDIVANGRTVHTGVYADTWKEFSVSVPLRPGDNVIRFVSTGGCTPVAAVHPRTRDAGCYALVIRDINASLVDTATP
ncbi:MAG: hypothetical protein SVW77_00575 [Candidatus Nanohaloarchaea archaeon]|nr:hypothetical protein [Candidatus Nanohaloarchaea archaeon]